MRALRFHTWGAVPELRDVADPDPGAGEVLVRVAAAGACHTDLHLVEDFSGETLGYPLPFTIGHETAGTIEAFGAGVKPGHGLEVGAPVAVYAPWGCGRCGHCRSGMDNYCVHGKGTLPVGAGLGRDGGMAEMMLVPAARFLAPIGDLSPVTAAPLTDAGLTPYHAIKRSLPRLVPGSTAVVIGVGGLGHLAVQLLTALCSTQVIAVDRDEAKLQLALAVGADRAVIAGGSAAEEIRACAGAAGCQLVLDCVGAQTTVQLAAQVVGPLGHINLVGIGGGALAVSFFTVPRGVSVTPTFWGTRDELGEVIALADRGDLEVHVQRFPLAAAAEAYAALRRGEVSGRAVVVPG